MKTDSLETPRSSHTIGNAIYSYRRKALVLTVFLLVAIALFFPALQFEFLDYDDPIYILGDPAVQHINWENLKTILFEPYVKVWYPIARLSAAFDVLMFGHSAAGHHLMSALIHFFCAVALFQVLCILGQNLDKNGSMTIPVIYPALLVSLLFLVHPQHVETVAWIVQRKELLATLFSLIATALYLRGKSIQGGVCLVLAMLSKPTAIVLPLFLILLSVALIGPTALRPMRFAAIVLEKSWAILLSAGIAALVLINTDGHMWYNDALSPIARCLLYADNVVNGLSRFIKLQPGLFQQPVPDYVISVSALGVLSLIILGVLLGVCFALMFSRNAHHRLAAVGFLFYCAALLPTGGLILFGNYSFGDRYLYLSSVGLYLVVYVVLLHMFNRFNTSRGKLVLNATASSLLLCAFVVSFNVLPKWTSSKTVWMYDIDRHPDAVFANLQLGLHYFEQQQYQLALQHFAACIGSRSEPFRIDDRLASTFYMAEIFCATGREDEAVGVLAQIPRFGGNILEVEDLMVSLQYSGYHSCYGAVKHWYESARN